MATRFPLPPPLPSPPLPSPPPSPPPSLPPPLPEHTATAAAPCSTRASSAAAKEFSHGVSQRRRRLCALRWAAPRLLRRGISTALRVGAVAARREFLMSMIVFYVRSRLDIPVCCSTPVQWLLGQVCSDGSGYRKLIVFEAADGHNYRTTCRGPKARRRSALLQSTGHTNTDGAPTSQHPSQATRHDHCRSKCAIETRQFCSH